MKLEGSTALVTGAASGLGRATVELFLQKGCNVIAGDIVSQQAMTEPDEIVTRYRNVSCDVTETDSIERSLDIAIGEFGRLDIVVNCAGVYGFGRLLSRAGIPIELGEFTRIVDVNLIGTINVFRLAAARMAKQVPLDDERGVMIAVASIAAFDGGLAQAAYTASKAAVAAVTHTLALDLAPHLIRVTSIAPGAFETPMLAGLGQSGHDAVIGKAIHPARVGQPREFAALASHIVENQMLNGTTLRLDAAARLGG